MLHEEPGYMSADPFFVATVRIRNLPEVGSQMRSARRNPKSLKTGLTRGRRPYMSAFGARSAFNVSDPHGRPAAH